MKNSFSKLPTVILFFGIIAALALTIYFSPEEKVLGSLVKLVYLHAGLAFTALLFYLFVLIFSIVPLWVKDRIAFLKSLSFTALIFWVAYLLSSLLVAYLAWGNVNWSEPRLRIAWEIIFAAVLFLYLAFIFEEKGKTSLIFYFLFGLVPISLWLTRYSVLHPNNPVGRSPSLAIKVFSYLINLEVFSLGVLTFYFIYSFLEAKEVEGEGVKYRDES